MHFPLASVEANVRAFVKSVAQGSASANPSAALDDALISKKAAKRRKSTWNHDSRSLAADDHDRSVWFAYSEA